METSKKPHRELQSPEPVTPTHQHGSKPRVMQSGEIYHQALIQNAREARTRQEGGVELGEEEQFPIIEQHWMVLWGKGYDMLEAIVNINTLVNQAWEEGWIPVGGQSVTFCDLGSPLAEQLDGAVHITQGMQRDPDYVPSMHFVASEDEGGDE